MALKRKNENEVDNFNEIEGPLSNADVHAAVVSLSPSMKKAKTSDNSYFDGAVTDGTSQRRVVGFSSRQQKKLASLAGQPVLFKNCVIEKSKYGDEMEIVLNQSTEISPSPKNITPPRDNFIQLNDLSRYFDKMVSVKVKVVTVCEPETVGVDQKRMRDIIISDSTARSRLTLWEEKIHSVRMIEGESYSLSNVVVKNFQGAPYLSMVNHRSVVTESGDEDEHVISNVLIIGVRKFENYMSCLESDCEGQVTQVQSLIGKCSECSMPQRIDRCSHQLFAELLVQEEQDTQRHVTLSGCGEVLCKIADILSDVTAETLLNAAPFSVTYNNKNVITEVTRQDSY